MKLPSIFKTASYQRFEIKPRYYDPIKEEIEERTARIKRELEEANGIPSEERLSGTYGGSIKGSFSGQRGMKSKETSIFNSATLLRSIFFLGLILATFGYIYIGPETFTYLTYFAVLSGGIYFLFKFLKKGRR